MHACKWCLAAEQLPATLGAFIGPCLISFVPHVAVPPRSWGLPSAACLAPHSGPGALTACCRDKGSISHVSFSQVNVATRLFDPRWWPGQAEPIYVTAVPRDSSTKVRAACRESSSVAATPQLRV